MAKEYWKIVELYFDESPSLQQHIADVVGCSQPTVQRTIQRWIDECNPIPLQLRRGKDERLGKPMTDAVLATLDDDPDLYLREISRKLQRQFGGERIKVSRICRALQGNNLTSKVLEKRAVERDRLARSHYQTMMRIIQDLDCLVYIDESHFDNRSIRRRRGRSPRGVPAVVIRGLG